MEGLASALPGNTDHARRRAGQAGSVELYFGDEEALCRQEDSVVGSLTLRSSGRGRSALPEQTVRAHAPDFDLCRHRMEELLQSQVIKDRIMRPALAIQVVAKHSAATNGAYLDPVLAAGLAEANVASTARQVRHPFSGLVLLQR